MLIGKKNKKNSCYKMLKKNLFWRFNGNERKYLTDILKRGLKPKKYQKTTNTDIISAAANA